MRRLFPLILLWLAPAALSDVTFEGEVQLQSRWFAHGAPANGSQWHPSLAFAGEWVADLGETDQLVLAPFVRLDAEDSARTHGDFRELYWSRLADRWELSIGMKQVFWGVTEFDHRVDIINQTDQVENIDDEDRLGQPMVQLSLVRDWGILDLFTLVGFRERTFQGNKGRLRLPVQIDEDRALYDSGAQERRLDAAARWSHSWRGIDFGLHHFSGTSRDPEFVLAADGQSVVPRYEVIDQTGLDAQLLRGDWAFKLEALSRSGAGDRYSAGVVGLERTLVGVFDSSTDVGLVAEYLYDDRGDKATNTVFEQDIAVGARLTFNDHADTQALVGFIWDHDSGERVVSLEAQRQLGPNWALSIEGRAFSGSRAVPPDQPFRVFTDLDHRAGFLEREDYLQFELKRYF